MLAGGAAEKRFSSCLDKVIGDSEEILDVGTSERFAKELRPYEARFAGKRYLAAGYQPSMTHGRYNCDCHQDIEHMTFPDSSFDAVICLEVLEHVKDPFQAVREILRVLRPGGRLLLTVPFLTSYHGKGGSSHDHSGYPDFWRFTHQGLALMFSSMKEVDVTPLDGPIEVRLNQLYLYRLLKISVFRRLLDSLDKPTPGKASSRHMLFGIR